MRVLKFPHSDNESKCVLIQVTSAGRKPLDLKLVATEGDEPYACFLKHDRVASLRVKNCPVSEKEWEHILDSLLQAEQVEDIQATATVQTASSISLTVRKQVQGITQRLGAIKLNCDQSEGIELFQWCETALNALSKSKEEAASSSKKANDLEAAVTELQVQLDELVRAKSDDETALLQKFRDLLNEKKVKIRQQQKILAASSVNGDRTASSQPSQAADVQTARRPPAQSRSTKRKARSANVEEATGGDEDEVMEDDAVKQESDDADQGDTSEGTVSTAADDDDEEIAAQPARGSAQDNNRNKRQKTPPKKAAQAAPPPRSLPFAKRNAAASAGTEQDTDSDDEL
ncbi:hypothetical protein TOPH_01107 [Tolypocladium ophioglossoides CBS 100239]|uniref:DNA repair protein XRCC4 n=1 Tax=Tolypocladium ophioglossoides (strain CBS 100239) TaxID=1163406 RepID=A0A0L0NK19_TOLOC|nr:hypothetical protein TOPH_01107 [Tolypocladium ophioglossoides CBS 100239]